MNKNKLILISIAVAILIFALIFCMSNKGSETVSSSEKTVDKNLLVGDWVRTDASYMINLSKVNDDGSLEAHYFNPNPINVGKATWMESNGDLKVVIELRDVNYPGSTYRLNFLPDRSMLAGEYFQAVEGLTFYVEFLRRQ